ncbi:hypothetical protein PsorP6_008371 [Peronosclerospora sorghi]|uniref:Uncharacterized protein n=1 Tax=Peronosclerospora sorghi TaxID=230839 RepID=A0ACC0W8D8_9STRA|nr:hypothetical protein PsorP6_008371 [Peronosclerospora sorghi]
MRGTLLRISGSVYSFIGTRFNDYRCSLAENDDIPPASLLLRNVRHLPVFSGRRGHFRLVETILADMLVTCFVTFNK